MPNTSHTPGPWTVYDGDMVFGANGATRVADCWPNEEDEQPATDPEVAANARLIAAAPQMADDLVALKAERDALLKLVVRARDALSDLNQSEEDGGALLEDIDAILARIDKAGAK